MINLFQAMQAFVKVADAGSFAQAAEQLSVSTSVVTRHVSSLEKHLGIRLLQRTTRKVVLTEAGADYADGCRVVRAICGSWHWAAFRCSGSHRFLRSTRQNFRT
jgi:DNA-binding transcriptional LysR family regulator